VQDKSWNRSLDLVGQALNVGVFLCDDLQVYEQRSSYAHIPQTTRAGILPSQSWATHLPSREE